MAEQDIFSLLGEDEGKIASDMSDLNPTLGVTPQDLPGTSATATAGQAEAPKPQQQVTMSQNVLTGKDPMMSQGMGAAVASQLTSVQVKQMNTPTNPMWGSPQQKPQTIVVQQTTGQQPGNMSHHDYAISGQKLTKVGGQQQQVVIQQPQKPATVQSQLQLQQQKTIQQQLQLSQQQQEQIKQQIAQLQQKQIQIQQQQQLQQLVQQQQKQGGFQQLQGGQTITLSGLQQKVVQQSPSKIATVAAAGGSPQQQTILRLPVSMTQVHQQQQQQSLHITPSSTAQTVTIQQPKPATATSQAAGGSPRFIITRQPTAQQGNQPVALQLQMQDVNSLQRNIGKLQTLPGGQVLRIQPQQQAGLQTVVQPQMTLTNVSPAAGTTTNASPVRQGAPQGQRVITLTPQQLQQLLQRAQQQPGAGSGGLRLVQQNAATTPSTATSNPQVVRTLVLPQASTATSVGQVLRTLVVPSAAPSTTVTNSQVAGGSAGVATQNLNLLASQAASATSAAQILQRIVVPQSGTVSASQAGKQLIFTTQAGTAKTLVFASRAATAPTAAKPIMLTTQAGGKPIVFPTAQAVNSAGQVVRTVVIPQTSTQAVTTQSPMRAVVSTVTTTGLTRVPLTTVAATVPTGVTKTILSTTQAISAVTTVAPRTTAAAQPIQTVMSTRPVLMSSPTTQVVNTSAATVQQILSSKSPTKSVAAAPLQFVRTIGSQQITAVSSAASTAAIIAMSTAAGTSTAASTATAAITATATSTATPTSTATAAITATAASTAASVASAASTVLKTTPSTQAPGGKITISAATAQMLAQKGIVLTKTPQGTFVAKIPQSMLLKAAAAQGQQGTAGKQGLNVLNLLGKSQSLLQGQSSAGGTATTTTVKPQVKGGKAQPTILGKTKKSVKSPPAVVAAATASSSATMPKLVFTMGGQQIQATIPATTTSADKPPKMVLSLKPGMSAADEVKKIGEELGKLQGQSKTPENLQKLKDLHAKLKQLQLTVQASAVAAKAKVESGKSSDDSLSPRDEKDSLSPKDEKERKKLMKQRQLQDKANRIVAEAVAKAKASGLKDIPKIMINVSLPEVVEEETHKPKKEKKRSKPSRPKSSKNKRPKSPKPPKPPKEKRAPPPKKKPKKLPLAALNKLKKQRKKMMMPGEESDDSEYDETPPPTPDPELSEFVEKRRSSRNTDKRKKYTEEYDFNITDDSSSSSSDDGDSSKPKVKKEKKMKSSSSVERTTVISKESEDAENNLMIDVETVEPMEQAKFFVDNPDESQANIVEKILSRRTVKKPQLPGEAQVGEVEEFFVKFRSYSYLHCEWGTQEKLLKGDPRILQKIRRFRAKQHTNISFLQDTEEEPFNPDYIEVERVMDKAITEDPDNPGQMVTHYLIKWCSLPYEEATWEVPEDVDDEKVKVYEKFSKPPPVSERKRVPRGRPGSWEKMEESRVYKNDNTLREYQLEGVNWLTFSWFNEQNCILADEMGLGKTIQALTFLEEIVKQGIRGPYLVIAPLSTIANWQREFEAWTDFNTVVYHGSSQSRHMIAEYELYFKDSKGRIIPDIYKFQVLITTYEIVLADCQELSEIEWRVVVIDEAHRLKNRNCKLLEGLKILDLEHRVLLTGTPLQNNVEELFSLLNFLEPGQFRSSSLFMEQFGDLKSESQVEKLQQILRPMMLRRLKEDVEKNLAPKEETIIEVELTNIQKKYYRAILERNFNFLNKGTNTSANLPNLMNTMMELRKCCNHPFLIQGAEEQIMLEFQNLPEDEMPYRHIKALVQSAGKMVLLDKLLPKLKEGGHKVLIFSQMIRCLDILEDYLITRQYPFERIDGRVRGNMRQAAIDRFSKPDSDRFVFLLCTRAGGLGINLTAADTCVIFDSDWNPQNDLQAQARCHRIGQVKAVKVYRLITRNSYEREMFDKASMKLGLDKAVLQSMRSGSGDKDAANPSIQPLSKTEIEDLLKRGAYGAIMDDDDAASKFCEEDIDIILQRRTQIITIDAGEKGSTFAKASFSLSGDKHASDIKLDDPDFWEKWAKRADLDVDQLKNRENLLMDEPRKRKQTARYGNMDMVNLSDSDSDGDGPPPAQQPQQPEKPSKKQLQSGWTRLECFRVEKGLLTYGWGRWNDIISTTRFKRRLGEKDIEAISRTMLIYCLLHYKGDENIKSFIWDLVTPAPDGTVKDYKNHKGLSAPVPRGRKGRKPKKEEPVVPAILEYDFNNKDQDPETLLTDQGYKNHLKRHCNKVLLRVRLLYYLKQEVIGDVVEQIEQGMYASDLPITIPAPEGEPPISWWDEHADKSLMVGVFKHGYERYVAMRNDPSLCFLERCGQPNQIEIARENSDDFNDSQLDVEGTDGPDGDIDNDLRPSGSCDIKDELNDSMSMDVNDIKDESMSSFPPSRTGSPAPNKPKIDNNIIIPCEPGKLPFPPAPDLNTRLRRLVATCQRNHKRQQMKVAKKERREHVKKIRFEEQLRQRELRKLEHAQKWSRREEADFYRILAAYGVDLDPQTGKYNWTNFKKLAKLEKKYDERMQEYYEHFRVMCLKVCKKDDLLPPDWESRPPPEFTIEGISEERANKCLQRIDLLLKIRNEILTHPDRDRRLKRCRRSMELPEWWEPGKHDRDLIIGTARYGINRTESQLSMMNDPDLSFQELKERYPKWHLPASAFFPPAPPKTVKKEKTNKDVSATNANADEAEASTSMDPENPPVEVKKEVDPDTGEGASIGNGDAPNPVQKSDPDRVEESQGSSQSSLSGMENSESLSQDLFNNSTEMSQENRIQGATSQELDSLLSSQDVSQAMDVSQDVNEDKKPVIKSEYIDEQERTSGNADGVEQMELCRPPGDAGNALNPDGSQETKPAVFQPEFDPAEFLRWPKDRVIVHRLEQISHCVLKGEWPGRRRHHHPNDPNRSQTNNAGGAGGDGVVTPAEHNYAGDEGREDTKTILPKKKKRRKRAEIEQERAAQLAVLLGQNPSLGLHPVFSSLMTSLPLAANQVPANMATAALSPLDLSQNPTTSTAATSQYHIQDAEFRPGDAAAMQAAMLAMGGVSGMQHVVHKKKKKHKTVKTEGAEPADPEAAERRRKRKLELLERKKRRKRKQKDKAKEMSDAFNALKDDDHVPVMNPRTGERYIGPAAPMKKQLGAWMKEHPGFELLYPFHAVVSPDGTSVSFPPLPKPSQDASDEPPKKKKKKSQRNPAKLDPAKLTGEERVDVIDRNTGKKLPFKLNPTLNNLAEWLVQHPALDVASEWGSIVKGKGYIGEELYGRISHLSMKAKPKPAAATTTTSSDVGTVGVLASGLSTNKLSMQIGQGSLGGLGTLGLASFTSPATSQQLAHNSAVLAAAAQQLQTMQAQGQSKIKTKTPKKKKLKTNHPVVTKPVQLAAAPTPTPPVSGVPSLAGISPYLLPTQGGVFYSPFLASHNVQGLISATTTAAPTSTTNSLDNDSQSSVDSKFNRTEPGDTDGDVGMSDGALGNFTDDNDSTFAGVDLGDLEGELDENVINDIAMDDGEA